MDQGLFYEAILDNIPDGIYVLDNGGNYIFVNSAYVKLLHMTKNELLHYNVHDFYSTGQIDVCISDIVYREKHRVVMFQDVFDALHIGRSRIRQLVTSIPIFDEKGNVQNIVAIVKSLDSVNQAYYEASISNTVSSLSVVPDNYKTGGGTIIAEDPAMRRVLELAKVVSGTDSTVLITGESGAGKDLIARYIHECSGRGDKPFVIINCASLPENLLEAELFGYERGAFTGAAANGKKGLFEAAEGGTLFLDEINSLPLSLQGKLLRAIENKTIQHIGSTQSRTVNFRLLVASNQNLEAQVQEQKFRADLFYRLSVIPINVPPLREHRQDIVHLAEHFIKYYCEKYNKVKIFSPQTLENMHDYDWPGNVRELKNFVERSIIMTMDQIVDIPDISIISAVDYKRSAIENVLSGIPIKQSGMDYRELEENGVSLGEHLDRCERDLISWALQKYGSTYKAAAALGTSQGLIMRRKKKYRI